MNIFTDIIMPLLGAGLVLLYIFGAIHQFTQRTSLLFFGTMIALWVVNLVSGSAFAWIPIAVAVYGIYCALTQKTGPETIWFGNRYTRGEG